MTIPIMTSTYCISLILLMIFSIRMEFRKRKELDATIKHAQEILARLQKSEKRETYGFSDFEIHRLKVEYRNYHEGVAGHAESFDKFCRIRSERRDKK